MPQLSPTYGILIFLLVNLTLFFIIILNTYNRNKKMTE
uniref:ATP synthase complex subunit 8 n=1 Tax=Physella acuta TaxID=109671 RepID=V9IPH0_PHYAT|nr:ATP synthase F0 subunit 8 [Physella acuta]WEU79005.1 ATP synthase F0 subunit 8 [Physella acuta]WEU79018.1 ATP synthase F0 subunit 8 [Physella acuta]WEU79031.1 ATP synthase F0 subunit 8 [Physella acuta]WEU79044.1 ATP synthase F0 subunit 8 [Physella acuta]